ncbi:MAG TPA: hypothetical protein VHH15_20360 [Actinophytocola sp.]|nr:hypothetical protein [Actinophytocola sp.]
MFVVDDVFVGRRELALDQGETATAHARLNQAIRLADGHAELAPIAARAASTLATSYVVRGDARGPPSG